VRDRRRSAQQPRTGAGAMTAAATAVARTRQIRPPFGHRQMTSELHRSDVQSDLLIRARASRRWHLRSSSWLRRASSGTLQAGGHLVVGSRRKIRVELPHPKNGSGVSRATNSSASPWILFVHPGGATGDRQHDTPSALSRATWQAARAVEPVAMPSSTMITVRPLREIRGRSPRNRRARRSSSVRSRLSTMINSSRGTPAMWTTAS